jgi:hypothetical protein
MNSVLDIKRRSTEQRSIPGRDGEFRWCMAENASLHVIAYPPPPFVSVNYTIPRKVTDARLSNSCPLNKLLSIDMWRAGKGCANMDQDLSVRGPT